MNTDGVQTQQTRRINPPTYVGGIYTASETDGIRKCNFMAMEF
ncbi:MAG: hypothetical protein ACRCUY_02640 [Thermoguttaceae bacterium]